MRPAQKKATVSVTEKSLDEGNRSNEENAPPRPSAAQQSRATRSVNNVINGN